MPDNQLLRLTVTQFLTRLGADEPTPGGGSVAALTGALAAGLGQMACAFTLGRPKFADVELQIKDIALRLERAGHMLQRLVNEDADAYATLSAAFKLAKTDATRPAQIARAAGVAAGVPFQTAALSRQVHTDLQTLGEIANPRLISDVEAGVVLAEGAYTAAVANVRINIPYMEAADAERMQRELDRLISRATT